jgi:hypothetical protein
MDGRELYWTGNMGITIRDDKTACEYIEQMV